MSLDYSDQNKDNYELEVKGEETQQEYAQDAKPAVETAEVVPVSNYATLTPNQTMRKFWRLYCAAIATSLGAV